MAAFKASSDLSKYMLPSLRKDVAFDKTQTHWETLSDKIGDEIYPFMGTQGPPKAVEGSSPVGPQVGPSMPESGSRLDSDPFQNLSRELADRTWKRTEATMKGAKLGC